MRLVLILIAFMMKLFVLCLSVRLLLCPELAKVSIKEAAVHANNIWRATGIPKQGQIFINREQTRLQYRRKIREGHRHKLQIHTY